MASRLWHAIAVLTLATAAQAGVWQGKGPRDRSLRRPPPAQLSYNHVPLPLIRKEEDLPKNHDWCNLDGTNFCTASWNQHIPEYCGSCWVHGSLSMVQDRLKILKKAKGTDVMLGRQTLLNCAHFDGHGNGCDGGDTWDVFSYMTDSGLPDEGCLPYNATDHIKYGVHAKECPTHGKCMNCMPIDGKYTCWAIKKPVMYHLTNWGKVEPIKGQPYELAMMNEIYERGPITCGMVCPEDFTWDYKGGIYHDTSDETELDHDVEVVGWGEENGVKFWKVRNSWGAYWGELGFFRVERGHNGLQLESGDCWYAIPENSMEQSIASGELHGSMWGVRKSKAGDAPDGPDAGDEVIHQKQEEEEEEEHEERDDGDDDNDDREEEKHHSHKHRHSHEDKHAGKQSGHDAEDGEDAEVPEWHADGAKGTERMAHIKLGHADRVAANYRRLMGRQL